jgi:hypothetical protein
LSAQSERRNKSILAKAEFREARRSGLKQRAIFARFPQAQTPGLWKNSAIIEASIALAELPHAIVEHYLSAARHKRA